MVTGVRPIITLTFLFLSVALNAVAADFYVNKSGSDSNGCTNNTTDACLTITAGISALDSSDTLIVGDGVYVNQPITGVPSGSAGNYTVIKSENIGGAVVDMSSVSAAWLDSGIYLIGALHHIQVEGFKIIGNTNHTSANSNGAIFFEGSYNKLIRVSGYGAGDTENMGLFNIGGSYTLVEECWAWGTGRYKFIVYYGNNVIVRRCVARHDYHGGNDGYSHQEALFTNYDSTNTIFQNCIGLDSGVEGNVEEGLYGGFWDENNANIEKTGKVVGTILLNLRTNWSGFLDKVSGTRTLENNIVWDSGGGYGTILDGSGGIGTYGAHSNLSNMTIGEIVLTVGAGDYQFDYGASGFGVSSPNDTDANITTSIIYNTVEGAITGYVESTYNSLYGNSTNYADGASGGVGDTTAINPLVSGLLYLPRIESGSALETAGVGATILYKHGSDGTLYGETGYDTLTSEPLWPFPNEALIKADFASYSGPGPAGARGFAASGTQLDGTSPITLTSYIWEYLGNEMPADIYGEEEPVAVAPLTGGICPGCTITQ